MLRVGLTGGIACGKSVVGEMLASRGAHLIQADRIAHDLMRPGQPVYRAVVDRFGPEIVTLDGEIDRPRLAAIVFADKTRLEELNQMVHPAVIRAQEEWMDQIGRREPQAIAVVEAALIYEAGLGDHFDKVVVVACPPERKVERLARRMGVDDATARTELERRSKAQIPDDEKIRRADYVVDNSGTLETTEAQVQSLFAELQRLASTHHVSHRR